MMTSQWMLTESSLEEEEEEVSITPETLPRLVAVQLLLGLHAAGVQEDDVLEEGGVVQGGRVRTVFLALLEGRHRETLPGNNYFLLLFPFPLPSPAPAPAPAILFFNLFFLLQEPCLHLEVREEVMRNPQEDPVTEVSDK